MDFKRAFDSVISLLCGGSFIHYLREGIVVFPLR